ncbi:MAG: glycosyltransferase [Syntrophomonas sp.]
MANKRLSLCIIAKNEADNIRRCINSVESLADEVIVVDTGSKDGTPDIAGSLGARVIETLWEDDFSKARNLSLELAEGKWILFLDCDEELAPDSLPVLNQLLDAEDAEAYFLKIINTTAEGMQLIVSGIRLFRNRKEYRFAGRIHEQIAASIVKHSGQSKLLPSNVSIIHWGYNQQCANIAAKIQRNMRILKSIPEDQRDGFYYYNLGTEYLRIGQKEEALANYLKAAPLTHPGQGYGAIMIKRIITLLFELGRYRQALQCLDHYQEIFHDFTDLILLTGVCHFMCGRYSEAKTAIGKYLSMPPAPQFYPLENSFLNQSPERIMEMAVEHAVPRDYPPLSVCIIGKNEIATLATCIKSVNEIAAQVIYVDSGSSDNSREVAFELGAEVHSFPWEHDFSSLRNYALERVREEWVLVLDADEVLPETSVKAVIKAVKEASGSAYLAKIHTPLDTKPSTHNYQIAGSIRLFRKGARYRGAFAEELVFEGLNQQEPVPDLEIIHLHFQAPLKHIEEKAKTREEVILRTWSNTNPMYHFMLGREAVYAQQAPQAVAYFKRAFELELEGRHSTYYYYTLSLINTGDYKQAIKAAEQGLKAFPDYTDLWYLKAIAHGLIDETAEAESLLMQCLRRGETKWWEYLCSPGTGNFKALLSLGTIYARQGKLQKAVDSFIEAARIPDSAEQAIEHLVKLQESTGISIDMLLKKQGLYNWKNVIIAAQTYAKMAKRKESWNCLNLLKEESVTGQTEFLNRVIGIVETHLFNTKHQVSQHDPDHPILKCL